MLKSEVHEFLVMQPSDHEETLDNSLDNDKIVLSLGKISSTP